MATYQTRQRDPLLDQGTAAMLERRGRELLGLALIGLGLTMVMILASYSPEDPGWMVATDEPAANLLGRFGAAMASTLIIIGGMGAWGIPLVLLAWGVRFVLHRGADRALGRIVFAVIAVALGSVYAATLVPGPGWAHSFGLGGLFGDTVLGAFLGILPVGAGFGLKLMSVLMGLGVLGMGLFVTGFDMTEVRSIARFLLVGLLVSYNGLLTLAGRGAQGTVRAAAAVQDRRRAAADAAPAAALTAPAAPADSWGRPTTLRADPRYREPLAEAPHYAAPREKTGLLARMPALMRRTVEPEPELIERHPPEMSALMPSEDRIKARISDVIKSRSPVAQGAMSPIAAAIARREPPVIARARGPVPLIADTRRGEAASPPATPSATAPGVSSRITPPRGPAPRLG